jgi:hypothetical protein
LSIVDSVAIGPGADVSSGEAPSEAGVTGLASTVVVVRDKGVGSRRPPSAGSSVFGMTLDSVSLAYAMLFWLFCRIGMRSIGASCT